MQTEHSTTSASGNPRRLGEYLPVTSQELAEALEKAHGNGEADKAPARRLGEVLVEFGRITQDELTKALYAQRADRLRGCSVFSALTDRELARLCPIVSEHSLKSGEVLMDQETIGDCLYILASGRVQVFRKQEGSDEIPLLKMSPGETIGEMGYFSDGTRSASARAVDGPAELLRIRYADLPACFELVPNLAIQFLEIVTRRLRETNIKYQASFRERQAAEKSLKNLSSYLDMSASLALGQGIESLISRIVSTASKVMDADRATLFLLDPGTGELWSKVAEGAEMKEIRVAAGAGIVGHVAQHGETLNIPEAYDDPRFNRAVDVKTGYRTHTILCGPVRNMQGQVIGVVQVINKKGGPFSDADLTLFKAFTYHVAIAVENFHLYQRMRANHEKLAIMLDVANSVSTTLDIGPLIARIVQKIGEILGCDRASFFIFDRESNELWSMEARGAELKEIRFEATSGLAGHTARTGEVLNIADAYQDARFNASFDKLTGYRTKSVLCVPVFDRAGRVSGVAQAINKLNSPGGFDTDDVDLARAIAAQIGMALQNARLYAATVEMKNYLERVQQSISNGIVTLDNQYRVVTANGAAVQILDLGNKPYAGQDIRQLLAAPNDYVLALLEQVYLSGRAVEDSDVGLRVSERINTVNIKAHPLSDHTGARQGQVVVVEDITEERKVEDALRRMMPKELVKDVLQRGARLGGERRKATILFSDIRDFSTIAEMMSADQTLAFLNQYFTLMVEEVREVRGAVDKFIGDALMAIFGAALAEPDDAARAVRGGLRMIAALERFNAPRREEGLPPIRIGIGINTAEIVAGMMGHQDRLNYTVIGDGVNVAARLESLTKQYGIQLLISETTYAEVREQFAVRAVDRVVVKGKSRPVQVYEVLGEGDWKPTRAQAQCAEGLELYQKRDFRSALRVFAACAESDPLCRAYAGRCEYFIAHPPDADWDGVWHATMK